MENRETSGYNPSEQEKRYIEFRGEKFEIEDVDILSAQDIQKGDRVFISTKSGNRYMIRMSAVHEGMLKIYNEKEGDGFKTGYELHYDQGPIAEVGKGFSFVMRISEDKGQKYDATEVTGIEIRRGLDAAIQKASQEVSGGDIARALIDSLKI